MQHFKLVQQIRIKNSSRIGSPEARMTGNSVTGSASSKSSSEESPHRAPLISSVPDQDAPIGRPVEGRRFEFQFKRAFRKKLLYSSRLCHLYQAVTIVLYPQPVAGCLNEQMQLGKETKAGKFTRLAV